MQAVLLAAGKGKRLQPFTLTRSKGMAPIAGKPMCARVVDSLIDAGLQKFIVVIGPDDLEIENYFISNYSHKSGLTFQFVIQQQRLGMAHAVNCTKELITENFIVSAGDSLVSSATVKSLITIFDQTNAMAALTLLPIPAEKISKSGIVALDSAGYVVKIVEKPKIEEAPSTLGSIPLYCFHPRVFDYIAKVAISVRGEYELQDAIQMIINDFGGVPCVMADYRLDLTNLEDLLALNLKFVQDLKENILLSKIPSTCLLVDKVHISPEVVIGENCVIGPNVFIENGCTVESNSSVKNSVLLKGSLVKEGSEVCNTVSL